MLDTHVVIDIGTAFAFESLPKTVRHILTNPEVDLLLSVVSEAEIAMKNRIGKLDLNKAELAMICSNASIESYPLHKYHADRLFEMPMHHKDPFDRLIIATALNDDLAVISSDERFRKYKGLRVIW